MTWEELKREAKKMGYDLIYDGIKEYLVKTDMIFTEGGTVEIMLDEKYNIHRLRMMRTPEQMLAMMKALQ